MIITMPTTEFKTKPKYPFLLKYMNNHFFKKLTNNPVQTHVDFLNYNIKLVLQSEILC